MSWVIIGYKPDSSDYSMGHLMESYCSDFEMVFTESEDEVVEALAELLFRNKQISVNETGYRIHVVEGDHDPFLHAHLFDKAEVVMTTRRQAYQLAEIKEAEREQKEEQRMRERLELRQLADLQAKYPED